MHEGFYGARVAEGFEGLGGAFDDVAIGAGESGDQGFDGGKVAKFAEGTGGVATEWIATFWGAIAIVF